MQLNNKRKEIIIPVSEGVTLTGAWLAIMSALTGLTQRENDVIEMILNKRSELVASHIKQPYLSQLLFSTDSRKEYCEMLKISEFNFTNLLGSLRKKRAIRKIGDNEDVFPQLIPVEEMLIKFNVQHDRGTEATEEDSGETQD